MRIFITGGAGYIGSHTSCLLAQTGHEVTIYDNLSNGRTESLPAKAKFIEGDVNDTERLNDSIASHRPDAIIHFAAFIEVEESILQPIKYYRNNFVGTLNVLAACEKNKVKKLVFSSTAAVYGEGTNPVTEESRTEPINPYGQSKLMSEKIIQDFARANPWFRFIILRYFNVAGAQTDSKSLQPTLKNGQFRERATHLVTLSARAAAGVIPSLKVFGTDYNTTDGTCIRDYIHVDDLASAHLKSVEYLQSDKPSDIFNCGYGEGSSVKQVVQAMKDVSHVDFRVEYVGRRAGDSALLVANSNKALRHLLWKPQFNDLKLICKSAFEWEKYLKNRR